MAMEVALGTRLRLDRLYGVRDGQTVAYAERRVGDVLSRRTHLAGAVPLAWGEPFWPAPFLQAVTDWDEKHLESRLHVPLVLYSDAFDDHLEGQYMKFHVALEAFGSRIAEKPSENDRLLVKSSAAYETWLASQGEALKALARESEEESLRRKIGSAKFQSSTGAVMRALKRFAIELDADASRVFKKEFTGGRNLIVHAAEMSREDNRDHPRDIARIARLRTLLVALVSRVVGYEGLITGWVNNTRHNACDRAGWLPHDPPWWPTGPAAASAAATQVIAEISRSAG